MKGKNILRLAVACVLICLAPPGARAGVAITNLVKFNGTNGSEPYGKLIAGPHGNFYGTTLSGGANSGLGGYGTLFQMTPGGALTTLVSFNGTNGSNPSAGLVADSQGNLYGTTENGGTNGGFGTVFQLTTGGMLNTLLSFNGTNGSGPRGDLYLGINGHLYGTSEMGGAITGYFGGGNGTVFEMTTNGTLINVLSFSSNNGAYPLAGFLPGKDGSLYSTTAGGGIGDEGGNGAVFQLTMNGTINRVASFDVTNGLNPTASLALGTDGNFYGTTIIGGTNNGNGTVFRLTPAGVLTSLVSFNGTDGANPVGGLLPGPDGNFYGVTQQGGSNHFGTVFQISPDGAFNSLVSFDSFTGPPHAGLVLGVDGSFYGITQNGIFRLTVPMSPVLQSATVTDGLLTLVSSAVAGLQYQVQCDSDPASTNWCNLGGLVTATNGTLTVSDSCTNSQRFYRLVLLNN
jgi:uncharacterized repeat protein (TIGR03803 family)